ncbi:hypothetical protein RDWZM_009181, partial [Blomia tropicalis]
MINVVYGDTHTLAHECKSNDLAKISVVRSTLIYYVIVFNRAIIEQLCRQYTLWQ